MSTTNILDLNNRIDKIEKAGIGTAAETSYSNTTSGLSATNVQAAIDEIDGATDNLSSAITDIEGDILAIEGDVEDLEEGKVDWTSEGILGVKNLLKYPYYETTKTIGDFTFTDNGDGTITLNGTTNALTTFNLHLRTQGETNDFIVPNGKYILSGCPSGGGTSKYLLSCAITKDGSGLNLGNDTGSGVELTFDGDDYSADTVNPFIYIQVASGVTCNNVTFRPMLRYAADSDDSYAPYAMSNVDITKRLQCPNTTGGTYTLKATVSSGVVTYAWTLDT